MVKHYKNIIIGAGLSGAIMAERIASQLGEEVLVIDRRSHIAGNIYDYVDKNGICVQKYGPHIFHTQIERVWEYLSNFTQWNSYVFKPKVVINGKKITLPFNLNSIEQSFESDLAQKLISKLIVKYGEEAKISILDLKNQDDKDLKFLADYIYKNVFEGYTTKQWGLKPEEIDPAITARVPVFISRDDRYFQDKYQGIPLLGYTKMVQNILKHPKIEVVLNKDFKDIQNEVTYDRLFFTGSIDEFFDYKYGVLPYRSLHFDIVEKKLEFYQETAMVNYPNEYDFTRITEHKHFLSDKSENTIISLEYPQTFKLGENERFYPISNDTNNEMYQKYLEEAKEFKNIYFFGRLGNYKYYNMDLVIDNALKMFKVNSFDEFLSKSN